MCPLLVTLAPACNAHGMNATQPDVPAVTSRERDSAVSPIPLPFPHILPAPCQSAPDRSKAVPSGESDGMLTPQGRALCLLPIRAERSLTDLSRNRRGGGKNQDFSVRKNIWVKLFWFHPQIIKHPLEENPLRVSDRKHYAVNPLIKHYIPRTSTCPLIQ